MTMASVGFLTLSQPITWSEIDPRIANVTSPPPYQRVRVLAHGWSKR